ncbi:MAG: MBL fold metallo-hydrolase [Bacteroidaceae bacterium]|nr:MBL fold metallo-hydrolase [Bacteroidaceae bacterium]
MTITILIDNALPLNENNLVAEHGLSLYIKTDNNEILCDTGASGRFLDNAKSIGLDIEKSHFAFISHGHNDHCGGIGNFFEAVTLKNVYMHKDILTEQYYSSRKGAVRNISCNNDALTRHINRIVTIEGSQQIAKDAFAIQCKEEKFTKPYGNRFLTKNNGEKVVFDNFTHELSLCFTTPQGLVIISPCSHCGVINIMEECRKVTGRDKIHAFIGGFHFVEGEKCIDETECFANDITKYYPDTIFYTGHCTCDTAKEILAKRLENIRFFTTGTIIEI